MEDTAIFELQVINRLKVAYPEAVWHFYLITAYLNIPQGYSLNFDEKTKELSEDFLHDHVAGEHITALFVLNFFANNPSGLGDRSESSFWYPFP